MRYEAIAETDIGIVREINQDSVLIKHGRIGDDEVLLAVVCDGMGGLFQGELASATVVKAFSKWFDQELPYELAHPDFNVLSLKWELMLKELNVKISEFGQKIHNKLGTTFTGALFFKGKYVAVNVGDTRLYRIDDQLRQLTEDHSFVAREVKRGHMTPEEAMKDRRRNILLQCVGASIKVEPELLIGEALRGAFLICSDGFRHEITEQEIYDALKYEGLMNKQIMHQKVRQLIETVKERQERDNISAVLIKVNA